MVETSDVFAACITLLVLSLPVQLVACACGAYISDCLRFRCLYNRLPVLALHV